MKNLTLKMLGLAIATTFVIVGCDKDDDKATNSGPGTVNIEFKNRAGGSNLELNSTTYTNAIGQNLKFTKFKYILSNFRLKKSDGTYYSVPESYYFIDEAVNNSEKINLSNIPEGNYTALDFIIGVDSARNTSGAQTGALDPSTGMFWTWNSGYIFIMMEGTSTASSSGDLMFHIGGYKAPNNCIRSTSVNFSSNLIVGKDKSPKLEIDVNVLEMFNAPNNIDFSVLSSTMGGPDAVLVADNYIDMFKFNSITN
jgi:hypothetical protein